MAKGMRVGATTRPGRSAWTVTVLVLSATIISSCGSDTTTSGPPPGTHTYMQAQPEDVWFLSIQIGRDQRISGSAEEVRGPGETDDRTVHTYHYRLVGSMDGNQADFRMEDTAPGRMQSQNCKCTISIHKVSTGLAGDVFVAATRKQFASAVTTRMPFWEHQEQIGFGHP